MSRVTSKRILLNLRRALVGGLLLLATNSTSPDKVNSTVLLSPVVSAKALRMHVLLDACGTTQQEVDGLVLSITRTGQGGWQQRFYRVHDVLELRVGGSTGTLISWPDRGNGGRVTWTSSDPEGDVRDITRWVEDNNPIRLWARISSGSGERQCVMDTLYNSNRRQRWEFNDVEFHEILR
jgi:hypothetical protein